MMDGSQAMKETTKVFVVDDHPAICGGIQALLAAEEDLEYCGNAGSSAVALRSIPRVVPDVIIVDIVLGADSGIELSSIIREADSRVAILVCSMQDEEVFAERALRAGANGYVSKGESSETVLDAIRTVASGGIWVSESVRKRMLCEYVEHKYGLTERKYGVDRLSDRERQVFELIGCGQTSEKISESLQINIKTVESCRTRIKRKLGLRDKTELAYHAVHWIQSGTAGRTPQSEEERHCEELTAAGR